MGNAEQRKKIKVDIRLLCSVLPFLLVLFTWVAFSKPYILDNLIPLQTRQLVAFFPPWNADPSYAGPIKNNAMPDVFSQIYPWKYFSIQQLKQGELPYWNPNNFSGNPHIANYQTALYSPFTLLYFILPFVDAWSITILLQPIVAGLGVYFFLKKIGVSSLASSLGSISFMFCGFMVVWMAYGTLAMSAAFLPWALYAIFSYLSEKKKLSLVLLIVSIASSFLSGHFQTSLYVLLLVCSYLIYLSIRESEYRRGFTLGLGILVGLLISSIQIIPTISFYLESFRSQSIVTDQGIPWTYFVTLFAPDIFGNPVTRNDWLGFYAERASFIGVIPFVLFWFSYFVRKNKHVLFFIFLSLITFVLAVDSPLQGLLKLSHIPIIATSNPTRIVVLLSLSLAVLAAYGLDICMVFIKNKDWKRLFIGLLPSVVIFLLTILFFVVFPVIPPDKSAIALRNLFFPFLFVAVGGFIGFIAFFRPSKTVLLLFGLLILSITSFDSYRFVMKWMPYDSRDLLYPDHPVITAMQTLQEDGRVYGSFGAETQTYYGIRSIDGYDPLYIKRYGEFIKAAEIGEYRVPDRSFVFLDRKSPYADRVLDLLSVKLFFQPKSHINQSWAYPIWEKGGKFEKVYEDTNFQLFKNKEAMSRFTLVTKYEVIPDTEKRLKRLYSNDFSYKDTIILEKDPREVTKEASVSGNITVREAKPSRIDLTVTSNVPALLFSNEPYYSQWKAAVNGKEVEILIADHALRAIEVPAGTSQVTFWYGGLFTF